MNRRPDDNYGCGPGCGCDADSQHDPHDEQETDDET